MQNNNESLKITIKINKDYNNNNNNIDNDDDKEIISNDDEYIIKKNLIEKNLIEKLQVTPTINNTTIITKNRVIASNILLRMR